jgi:hypothetical protein
MAESKPPLNRQTAGFGDVFSGESMLENFYYRIMCAMRPRTLLWVGSIFILLTGCGKLSETNAAASDWNSYVDQ